jgi:thiazole synthase ThiGH ThiG subunit
MGAKITSRLLLGTARYPSPAVLSEAVRQSATEIVTVSLRREMSGGRSGGAFFEMMRRPTNNLAMECLHRVNGETVCLMHRGWGR